MKIVCGDYLKVVEIGDYKFWDLIKEIVVMFFKEKKDVAEAKLFLETGNCSYEDSYKVAKQINLIRDELASIKIQRLDEIKENIISDTEYLNNISPIVTSFANLFITSNGEDAFYEMVKILCFSHFKKENIWIE